MAREDSPSEPLDDKAVAAENWERYQYARDRGHDTYCIEARRLEGYYLGGGLQWDEEDRAAVEASGRMALEINQVLPAVKAAIGYQLANRMDIAFAPRGGMATQEVANVLSKVAMQIAHNTELHHHETQVFSDGLIQRRGYFDVRINFDDSMRGEIALDTLDPMDVLPDPDAKGYDPDTWADVIVTRWLTVDEIGQRYGKKAKAAAQEFADRMGGEADFGDQGDADGEERNKFGDELRGYWGGLYDAVRRDKNLARLRVIDRQKFVHEMVDVVVSPDTGDVRVVEGMPDERLMAVLNGGGILTRRLAKRVRWIVSTCETKLHDDWSPYPWFTVVPYFPLFRRGKSRGMVDNAAGPQNALNKAISQYIHIINGAANSGWVVEEDSLTNMEVDDLEDVGGKTGVVIEYRKGSQPPEKIQPAQIPSGLDRMIDRLTVALKENTVPDAARGIDDDDLSGVSRQSKQFAAQQQLAPELDNLGRTRKLLARRILWCIQNYYDEARIVRITKPDPMTGVMQTEEVQVNTYDEATGDVLNNLTLGEYDVVISEAPVQVTFENGQFEQAVRLKEVGVPIPDDVLVRNSMLAEKNDVLQRMAQNKPDPVTEAEVLLKQAQARKTDADATARSVEAQFSAIQTAQVIAQVPATAPLADTLLKSAGYVDQDAPPIVPSPPPGIDTLNMPTNTNPLTPLNPAQPDVGVNAGIEGGQP